jgi:rubrerythrin
MPFGRKARPVRTYEFGCYPPKEGEERAIEEMVKRVRLWNALVELTRRYDPLREEVVAKEIKVPNDEEHRKEYWEARKAIFKREDVREELKELDNQEYENARGQWLTAGLHWCNQEEVKLAWQKAKKRPGDLRFHSSRDGGKLTVRWQKGVPAKELFQGLNNMCRLVPVPSDAYTSPVRSVRRRLSRSSLLIRIASEKRAPVWLVLPCFLHREIPEGLVRSVSVLRERVGTQWRWKMTVVVEVPVAAPSGNDDIIAIDLGWRKMPDGLRVAYWSDSKGQNGSVVLPNEWLDRIKKVEDLQSIRDLRFNEAIGNLKKWIGYMTEIDMLPEWYKERVKTLPLWKSTARLASLILYWREHRISGDKRIYDDMEEWRKRDKHLLNWEENLRDKTIRDRREKYRIFAAWVAKNYGTVRIEDFPIIKATKKVKDGMVEDMPDAAIHQRTLAAPASFQMILSNAVTREGGKIEKLDPSYTTVMCHACGSKVDFDHAKLMFKCPVCGREQDQDDNASLNLLSQKRPVWAQN